VYTEPHAVKVDDVQGFEFALAVMSSRTLANFGVMTSGGPKAWISTVPSATPALHSMPSINHGNLIWSQETSYNNWFPRPRNTY